MNIPRRNFSSIRVSIFFEPSLFKPFWSFPCKLFVTKPESDNVPALEWLVNECTSRMLNCKIVDEKHVSSFQLDRQLVLHCGEVNHINCFGLSFCHRRYSWASGRRWRSCNRTSRETECWTFIAEVEE